MPVCAFIDHSWMISACLMMAEIWLLCLRRYPSWNMLVPMLPKKNGPQLRAIAASHPPPPPSRRKHKAHTTPHLQSVPHTPTNNPTKGCVLFLEQQTAAHT